MALSLAPQSTENKNEPKTLTSCFIFNQARVFAWLPFRWVKGKCNGKCKLRTPEEKPRKARHRCRHFLWAIEKPQNCRFNFILLHLSPLPKKIVSLCRISIVLATDETEGICGG